MGELFGILAFIIYLAIVIYLITLASRFVSAVERIADKFHRGTG